MSIQTQLDPERGEWWLVETDGDRISNETFGSESEALAAFASGSVTWYAA